MGDKTLHLSGNGLKAVIFDLDGVITRTATVHFQAWKALFDEVRADLASQGRDFPAFTQDDYTRHVDGKPRYDGIRDFLAARGVTLAEGDPSDPPERFTVSGLGNRKNRLFARLLRDQGVEVFESAVTLVEGLRARGVRTAVVSSSKNCRAVLDSAGLTPLFDVIIDGHDAVRHGLAGKPAPDTFLCAARRLGVAPHEAAVVEDAVAGVMAGAAGGFQVVIGVDRGGGGAALAAGGADLVVGDLREIDID